MTKRRAVLFVLTIVLAICVFAGTLAACQPVDADDGKWTVTFYVDGVKYGEVKVSNNRRIPPESAPANPTMSGGKVFTAWYTHATDFTPENRWNMEKGLIKKDLDLYAGYRIVSVYPTDLQMAQEACTSKIVWTQSAKGNSYTVKIDGAEVAGSVDFDATECLVTFTPDAIPAGGLHSVSVTDNAHPSNVVTAQELMFGGAGTQANPYLVASALDFTAISRNNVAQGVCFKMFSSVTVEPDYDAQQGFVFDGNLDGNGKTVTVDKGNCGIIGEVGEHGRITTLNIAGEITTIKDSVGACAGVNRGRIEKVNVTASVTSTAGTVGSNGINALLDEGKGIAGGIVGTNEQTGVIYNCKTVSSSSSTGIVKAAIGGGCIAGYNKGRVESCVSEGIIGAANATETGGKTLSAYSYGGGVVGVNAGTVKECELTGSGKLLAQRYGDASQVVAGTNHIAFGGIAGYNTANGRIEKCSYSGIRVHGDEAIGGIAGINAGAVTDCLAEGIRKGNTGLSYVGGRVDVGGIVGRLEGDGSVANCISTVNVFAYTAGTAYNVAAMASDCVYVAVNSNANSLATNPAAVALTAPTGSGNVAVAETFDGSQDVKLDGKYLTTVNGNSAFTHNGTTIKLVLSEIPEMSLTAVLYSEGKTDRIDVYETPSTLPVPTKSGYKFVGWALTENGEVKFADNAQISYYDLSPYAVSGEVKLYAVFELRQIDENALNVSVWNNAKGEWITETQIEKIKADFAALLQSKGIDLAGKTINWIAETATSVADLGESVNNAGNIDVIVACGANVTSTGKVVVIKRAEISSTDYAGQTGAKRQAALLTENDLALELYAMLTGLSNGKAEITFNVNSVETKATVSEILANAATALAVTPEDGYRFIGWATAPNATAAQVTGDITYAAVKTLLTSGKVTLYPVIEEIPALSVTVIFNNGGKTDSVTVDETGTALPTVAKTGFDFLGWSFTEGGDVAFAKGGSVAYNDVKDHANGDNEVTLYAKFVNHADNTDTLNVSIWTTSASGAISSEQIAKIKTDFAARLQNKGIDVSTKTINWIEETASGVANLGASVNNAGNIDVIVACGGNVDDKTKGNVAILTKEKIASTEYAASGRYAALLTDSDLAKELYSMLTGLENATAEITFNVNSSETKATVSGILADKATAPAVTPEDGYKFVGWATAQDAAEAQVTGDVTYAKVAELLTGGKVTLYPVFEQIPATDNNDLVVVFYDKFFDEEKVDPLKNAFATYCTANGIACGEFTFICGETGNNAAFSNYLANLEGGFDVAIGGKATTKAPIAALDGNKGALNLNYSYDGAVEARPAVFMNERAITEAFKEFLQTEAAEAILTEVKQAN